MKTCQLCGNPTSGSVGRTGMRWANVCQPCKDNEDALAAMRYGIKMLPAVRACVYLPDAQVDVTVVGRWVYDEPVVDHIRENNEAFEPMGNYLSADSLSDRDRGVIEDALRLDYTERMMLRADSACEVER